jgi:hypothetical protein
MKHTTQQQKQFLVHKNPRGFVLPFTMLITVLVLFITTGVLTLLSKQQYFSKIYRQTQTAYYAADDAISCAITIDDTYTGPDGLGIFPSSSSSPMLYISNVLAYVSARTGTTIIMDDITCGQSPIFIAGGAPYFNPNFTVLPADYEYHFINPITILPEIEYGQTSTYNMRMDLGVDPDDITGVRHLYRCAKVTINKTVSYRQVVAQGYSSCDGTSGSIERAVVNTSVIQ